MTPEIDIPSVKAEVEAAFAAYEKALVTNDVAALDRFFLDSPATIRYGTAENLYGFAEIAAFRAARPSAGLARALARTVVTTFGHDFAVASTLFHRAGAPGKSRAPDADVGADRRWLACRRRPRQPDRRFRLESVLNLLRLVGLVDSKSPNEGLRWRDTI